jgi:two-component system, NtrC family, response regulator AtoC
MRLLVVSRDTAAFRPLWSIVESNEWHMETASSAWEALERVQSGVAPHVLILDLPRGDGDGLHVVRWLRRLRPNLRVIVTCSPEDADRKSEAIRLGVQEVLIRPFEKISLQSAILRHVFSPDNGQTDAASDDVEQLGPDAFFISASPITQELRAQAELLAEADVPVLILGERGSGKDTVARLIHKLSVRSGFKFLKVNCADMPGDLLEAELFGNGRFSLPAGRTGPGKFERAEKGTIFLDEIAEMPLGLQGRLMHILQDQVLLKNGSDRVGSADVRILAATSANIERALAETKLREDLYYRLSAFTVQVPPLRLRRSEITFLLQHSMHRLSKHYGLPAREFSSEVLDACQHYSWPGNMTELETFVKRYLVAGDKKLSFSEFETKAVPGAERIHAAKPYSLTSQPGDDDAQQDAPDDSSGPKSLKSLIQSVKWEAERNAIGTALQKTGWNRKAAARLLRVSYRTLLYKIDQYHMRDSEPFVPSFQASGPVGLRSEGKRNGGAS